ncbi:MAG TPA: Rieske (2Fe-2S) protein [Gammaproteobacteria bacterium]|nr:Rieske (2Fe-2S) protein [Gammaproteobacteria bacterium]
MNHRRHVVCRLADIPDNEARGFTLGAGGEARECFLVRKGARVFAYLNSCPHTGGRLDWKPHAFLTKDRTLIICSTHGAIFEIDTGRCVGGPCKGMSLGGLQAAVENGEVVVYEAHSEPGAGGDDR